MFRRKAIMKAIDTSDFHKLPNFIHQLRTHSMYQPVVEDLISRPGFIQKEYSLIDTKQGQTFYSIICFENKESFDVYFNDEVNQSLWIALELMATQEDITLELVDEEI